jgi:Tol biopolymer transport system component
VIDGRDAFLSPDGKRLAFARRVADGARKDARGNAVPVPRPFVRELATKKERTFPHEASPVGWTAAGALILDDRFALDPATGARVDAVAMPSVGEDLRGMAWTPDGRRVAYVISLWDDPAAWASKARTAEIAEAGAKPRALSLGASIDGDQPQLLSWSPDGARLFFCVVFLGEGRVPVRRAGVWTAEDRSVRAVGEMPTDSGIPGFHVEHSAAHREWKPPPGPRLSTAVWDAVGNRFAFVLGAGHGDADVYVANADGGEVVRVTGDGETKWGPAMDPAGRRVAVLVGVPAARPRAKTARLRVIDLVSGDATDHPLAQSVGLVGALSWTRDGTKVLYEMDGGGEGAEGTYAQAVPAAPACPADAPIRRVEETEAARVLRALASKRPERVSWAAANAEPVFAEEMLPAFRAALGEWVAHPDSQPAIDLIGFLEKKGRKEALPEVRRALAARSALLASRAIAAVVSWDDRESVRELDRLRTSSPERTVRAAAAGAMVRLGDARGWDDLPAFAKAREKEVRLEAVRALGALRDPRSVDLLIPLVEDGAVLREEFDLPHTLGDEAEAALAALTARLFERDRAAWTAWWTDEAKRTLPDVVPENPALAELARRRREREETYREDLRRRYGDD